MPNRCHNSMKITGTISEITRFKQTCIRAVCENKQAQLDFSAIDPMPDFVDNDALPYPTRSRRAYWAIEHWGTKGNAQDFRVTVDAPGCYEFVFIPLQPAGPCLGEDGKNVPRSRIFPARR